MRVGVQGVRLGVIQRPVAERIPATAFLSLSPLQRQHPFHPIFQQKMLVHHPHSTIRRRANSQFPRDDSGFQFKRLVRPLQIPPYAEKGVRREGPNAQADINGCVSTYATGNRFTAEA
jgi:hypothetical protein